MDFEDETELSGEQKKMKGKWSQLSLSRQGVATRQLKCRREEEVQYGWKKFSDLRKNTKIKKAYVHT